MNELELYAKKVAFDERCAFESLLQSGVYTYEECGKIQLNLLALLSKRCLDITGGASTSVRSEIAQSITESVAFTLGVYLKDSKDMQKAANDILCNTEESYNAGLKIIYRKVRSLKQFYTLAKRRAVSWDNDIYNATFFDGIEGFFDAYKPEFGAHEIHITADYPVCFYPQGYKGIDFMEKYIENFDMENRICEITGLDGVGMYCLGYSQSSRDAVFNLCLVCLAYAGEIKTQDKKINEYVKRVFVRYGGEIRQNALLIGR